MSPPSSDMERSSTRNRTAAVKRITRRIWRDWLRPYALLLAIIAPLKSAVVDWNWVPSGSMKPTILEGELVVVNKLAYDLKVPFTTRHVAEWADPTRGDVVVLFSPHDGTRLVKRVVGLPGDTIEIRNGVLHINGSAQRYSARDVGPFKRDVFEDSNPVIAVEHLGAADHFVMALPGRPAPRSFGPYIVPPGQYFVMGDSRDNSFDSRYFGPVARQQVIGRAIGVAMSFDPARFLLPRPARFIQPLSIGDESRSP